MKASLCLTALSTVLTFLCLCQTKMLISLTPDTPDTPDTGLEQKVLRLVFIITQQLHSRGSSNKTTNYFDLAETALFIICIFQLNFQKNYSTKRFFLQHQCFSINHTVIVVKVVELISLSKYYHIVFSSISHFSLLEMFQNNSVVDCRLAAVVISLFLFLIQTSSRLVIRQCDSVTV